MLLFMGCNVARSECNYYSLLQKKIFKIRNDMETLKICTYIYMNPKENHDNT